MALIKSPLSRGFFKKEDAKEWVKSCLRAAIFRHTGPVVLVVDNASAHLEIESVL